MRLRLTSTCSPTQPSGGDARSLAGVRSKDLLTKAVYAGSVADPIFRMTKRDLTLYAIVAIAAPLFLIAAYDALYWLIAG
jgi:hypothetical protein